MKFNLNDLNPGTWFYFDEKNPDSGRVKIRVLNTRKLAEIRDKTVRTEAEYKDGHRHEYQIIDHSGRDKLIWDYCICDWEGLLDEEEFPIECTTENKLKLMNDHIGFSLFVESCLEKLNQTPGMSDEDLEKN